MSDHYFIPILGADRSRKTAEIGGIIMRGFEVYENNGGGIALLVYGRDGEIEYIHTGYAYWPGQLSQDLRALQGGDDPATDWDGNEIDDFAQDNWGGPWGDLIADNWGTYPHNMGAAGLREFYPDTDDDHHKN